MTRKIDLPSQTDVLQALAELTAQTTGGPPSVVALARCLGLTNTTFWRHYPDIARDVAARRRAAAVPQPNDISSRQPDELLAQNAELRRANRDLAAQLDLAIANIQRLSIENYRLRQDLEASANVTRISGRRRGTPVPSQGS